MSRRITDCSVHTHSILCDGKNTLAEMAAAAYAAGVRCFGASGHSHTNMPQDQGNVLSADMSEYRAEVLDLRKEYAGRMEILLGLEWDSRSDVSPEGFDYWIGSVHSVWDAENGRPWCVDWKAEELKNACAQGFHGNFLLLCRQYYREAAEMAAKKPPILGHIDLVAKFNEGGALFDEGSAGYRNAALEALHAADPSATVVEINTGAISRGYRTAPYPAPFLLEEWRSMGGRIVITSDSHSADTVVYGYDLAAKAAKAAGFTECALLTAGGWVDCPL